MWEFFASQTDSKWQLRQFFDSCDYLSWPSYNPDDKWWQHIDDCEDQWWNTLTTPATGGEDTLMTPFMTHDCLMTTPDNITDDACDDIDNLYDIHCPHDWDQVTKRTSRWQQEWLTTLNDDVANLVWWQMWLLLTTRDDWSDDNNMNPTTLTSTGDYLG